MINQTKKARAPGKESGVPVTRRNPATNTTVTLTSATSKQHDHKNRRPAVPYALLMLAVRGAHYDRAFVRACLICTHSASPIGGVR